jgi:hypothetical protein
MSEIYCPECDAEFSTEFGQSVEKAKKSHNEWYNHNAELQIVI